MTVRQQQHAFEGRALAEGVLFEVVGAIGSRWERESTLPKHVSNQASLDAVVGEIKASGDTVVPLSFRKTENSWM